MKLNMSERREGRETPHPQEAIQNNMNSFASSFGRWLCCSSVTDTCGYVPSSRRANGQNSCATLVHIILNGLLTSPAGEGIVGFSAQRDRCRSFNGGVFRGVGLPTGKSAVPARWKTCATGADVGVRAPIVHVRGCR